MSTHAQTRKHNEIGTIFLTQDGNPKKPIIWDNSALHPCMNSSSWIWVVYFLGRKCLLVTLWRHRYRFPRVSVSQLKTIPVESNFTQSSDAVVVGALRTEFRPMARNSLRFAGKLVGSDGLLGGSSTNGTMLPPFPSSRWSFRWTSLVSQKRPAWPELLASHE